MNIFARLKDLARAAGIGCLEFGTMGRLSPLTWIVRRVWSARIEMLRPHFEPEVYVSQIRAPARRRLARRDPLLHYLVIGWREHRLPNRRFEPRFVEDDLCLGMPGRDPFHRFLGSPDKDSLPQNEVEAAAPGRPMRPLPRRALIFHHGRGGGSSKFLALFERHLMESGIEPLRLRAVPGCGRLVIWPGSDGENELFDLENDADGFLRKIREASIDIIVISHVIDFFPGIFALVERCVAAIRGRLWIILHDYYSLCPRVNLVDAWQKPCDVAPPATCRLCVASGGSEIGTADPMTWRRDFASFLSRTHRIIAPSGDAKRRLSQFIDRPIETWLPESDTGYPPTRDPVLRRDEYLQVAVLGSLNQAKGGQVLLDLARCQRRTDAPVAFTVFGVSNMTRRLRRQGVTIRGRYTDKDLPDLLEAASPHVILVPAIWPETWSFVLTRALELGLPVMTFAHGAQSERLRLLERTDLILPLEWIDRPEAVMDKLLEVRRSYLTA